MSTGAVAGDVDGDRVQGDIEACVRSQQALVEQLLGEHDVDPRRPSLLPGWSVGHTLTHIARNGDGVLRQLDGLPQYWNGIESRAADIEAGATRDLQALVDDVIATNQAVAARFDEVADWSGVTESVAGTRPKSMLPAARQREVEIHRVDLGLGYGFSDMPRAFVRAEVATMTAAWTSRRPMGLAALPDAVLALPEHDRLAWLWGRLRVDGVDPAGA